MHRADEAIKLPVKDADAARFKTVLAVEIIKALVRERLTLRPAHSRTGIAAADFSRIRPSRPRAVRRGPTYGNS